MKRYSKLLIVIAIMLLAYGVIYICILAQINNSFAYFRIYYGASRQDVINLGQVYGVHPKDFSRYGPTPFPVNYIEHMVDFDKPQSERRAVYRSEVESMVKGYVSKCKISKGLIIYLFYSDWLSPQNIFHGKALAMEMSYQWGIDQEGKENEQVLESIRVYYIGDSGEWDWENIAPICEPPARYANCAFRLPLVGCLDK